MNGRPARRFDGQGPGNVATEPSGSTIGDGPPRNPVIVFVALVATAILIHREGHERHEGAGRTRVGDSLRPMDYLWYDTGHRRFQMTPAA